METSERLESSVLRIIEAYRQLKEERDNLKRKVDTADGELRKAGETIQNLQLAIENYRQTELGYRDLTDKKNEINEHIKTIIQRIDAFEARNIIDQVTNV